MGRWAGRPWTSPHKPQPAEWRATASPSGRDGAQAGARSRRRRGRMLQPAHEPPDLSEDGGRDADDIVEADEAEDEVDDEEEDENSGELVYELAEWLPEQRVELSMLLESAGIAYNWDGA